MKSLSILNARGGIDVVTPETKLHADRVRSAENVVLGTQGSFQVRDGFARQLTLTGARNLWTSPSGMTLFAAGDTLYRLREANGTLFTTALATGIGPGPVAYCQRNEWVVASAGEKVLKIDSAGNARTLGVASLIGFTPTLAASTAGGLAPGSYGIAISAVNSAGEESGLSATARVTLAAPQGRIDVYLPAATAGVDGWNIYRTAPNGEELYLAYIVPAATSMATLGSAALGRREAGLWRAPLPPGDAIASYGARLFSARGRFLHFTDPFTDLAHAHTGFMVFADRCSDLLGGVKDGLYVGTAAGVSFLRGGDASQFELLPASTHAPIPGTGCLVPGSMFDPKVVEGAEEVLAWLSPVGYQIGLPGGRVLALQADRILLDAEAGSTAIAVKKGVKQLISAVESMTMGSGGAADSLS